MISREIDHTAFTSWGRLYMLVCAVVGLGGFVFQPVGVASRRSCQMVPCSMNGAGSDCWTGWSALKPIGFVNSCFAAKFGAPRQGACVPDAVATLQITGLENMEASPALEGLEQYSHVWLLWAAHLNGHDATQAK